MERPDALICALDDDPFVLEVINEQLSGLAPISTTTEWFGVNSTLAKHDKPGTAALICDISMPGIDGLEFCKIVRRFFPTVVIMVFTASETGAARARANPAVDAVVLKTDGVKALERSIRRLLDGQHRRLGT